MCLILFAYRYHPQYPLIIAANRDEYYARPTAPADWWPEHPDLLGGKDLQAGGTWLGITRSGRFAAVTNVREQLKATGRELSRGQLPRDFLLADDSNEQFGQRLIQSRADYRGYNLIFGQPDRLYYYSNRSSGNRDSGPSRLEAGIYGLSNAALDSPWPKVEVGKQQLTALLRRPQLAVSALFELLSATQIAADHQLPDTGVSLEWERRLSAIRITGPDYGTRTATLLLIDTQGQVNFFEQQVAPQPSAPNHFSFLLQS